MLLLRWNRTQRLTGYTAPREIAEKLFVDSLLFLRWIQPIGSRLLDLGAGAGIPGIPLKIAEPSIALTLLDARRRRTSFLSAVVRELGLEGVSVLTGRAEALSESDPGLKAAFDVVVARAAGPLGSIIPLALTFLRPGGRFVVSGPPAAKPTPSLPPELHHRWESLPAAFERGTRRFLVIEKA